MRQDATRPESIATSIVRIALMVMLSLAMTAVAQVTLRDHNHVNAASATAACGGAATLDPQTALRPSSIRFDAVPVLIDSAGHLGTAPSARRYKDDIQDMGTASDGLFRLRPVTFRYKKAYADGAKPIQYGLVAEEVAEVYPDLVVRGKDGQVESVQYYKLDAMLLNEFQKLSKAHAADQAQIADLTEAQDGLKEARAADQERIVELQAQVEKLQSLKKSMAALWTKLARMQAGDQ